jgi:YVTN family beta-propeller protein
VTVGGLSVVKVYRTDTFAQVATIPVGDLPHGVWPSGDGSRVYVGLENADQLVAIDTETNRVIATTPTGQGPQALVYVPGAVPEGDGSQNLQPLGLAGAAAHLSLAPAGTSGRAPTSVALFDQGLTQIMEASVTGLEPKQAYVVALAKHPDGSGALEPLASFVTNPAGSAIVNAVGPIRQLVLSESADERRYLVVAPSGPSGLGQAVQIQRP